MKEIIQKIALYQQQLENGALNATDLEPMLQCIRDLEEQVIVLRYKAFETEVVKPTSEKKSLSETKKVEKPEVASIEEPITLNFGGISESTPEPKQTTPEKAKKQETTIPAEAVNQTSLIDAIADMQENVSVNERFGTENTENSLGDKLRKAPINDLKSAIGLNQKFWFINNLFNEDGGTYNTYIDKINSQDNFDAAMKIINDEIKDQFNWKDIEDKSVNKFLDYVERRFMDKE